MPSPSSARRSPWRPPAATAARGAAGAGSPAARRHAWPGVSRWQRPTSTPRPVSPTICTLPTRRGKPAMGAVAWPAPPAGTTRPGPTSMARSRWSTVCASSSPCPRHGSSSSRDKREVYDARIAPGLGADPVDTTFTLIEQSRARAWRDRLQLPAPTVAGVQAGLAPGAVVLTYWQGDDGAAVVRVTRDDARVVPLHVPVDAIAALDRALRDPSTDAWRGPAAALGAAVLPRPDRRRRAGDRGARWTIGRRAVRRARRRGRAARDAGRGRSRHLPDGRPAHAAIVGRFRLARPSGRRSSPPSATRVRATTRGRGRRPCRACRPARPRCRRSPPRSAARIACSSARPTPTRRCSINCASRRRYCTWPRTPSPISPPVSSRGCSSLRHPGAAPPRRCSCARSTRSRSPASISSC